MNRLEFITEEVIERKKESIIKSPKIKEIGLLYGMKVYVDDSIKENEAIFVSKNTAYKYRWQVGGENGDVLWRAE